MREVWAVGHETARLNERAGVKDRWQSRAERKRHDASTVRVNEGIAHNVKCVRLCVYRFERGSNILCAPDFEWRNFDAERASQRLNLVHLQNALGIPDISYDC